MDFDIRMITGSLRTISAILSTSACFNRDEASLQAAASLAWSDVRAFGVVADATVSEVQNAIRDRDPDILAIQSADGSPLKAAIPTFNR